MVGAAETTGQRGPRAFVAQARLLVALIAALSPGCGSLVETGAPDPSALEPAVAPIDDAACPEGAALRALEPEALARCEERAALDAERLEGTPEGVARARRAAALALARARVEAPDEALERARRHLVAASRRRAVDGACEAELEAARLEARDRHDLPAAYVEAYRTVRRFDDGAHRGCVAEARRLLEVLAPFRPGPSALAAVDADPDADDPSVGLSATADTAAAGAVAPLDAFAAWARAQPATSSDAALESLAVLGGEGGADAVRLVLALSDVVRFEASELPADGGLPRRLAVLLPATRIGADVASSTAVGAGGLVRVRASAEGPGARVTLDLSPDARTVLFVLPEPFRVIVDVRVGDGPARPPAVAGERPVRLLVLDPGHGGDDYGARAFGLQEADITLDLALRVRAILRERLPRTRVVLTREEDLFVSLEQRTAMANAVGADAFVSIHLNAAWEPVEHGGVTTFVLDTTDDRQALRLAARENGTATYEVGVLSRILAGLHREEQAVGSSALAQRIHEGTLAGARRVLPRLYDRGVRSAMFHVLVGAAMPAVLVEASFMTRPDEAEALRTEAYRQALAEGIADGIVRFARGA
jgi:N-acetylmuramoyl-L-alanine amidase